MNIDIRDLEKPSLFDKFKTQTYKDYELSGLLDYLPAMTDHHFISLKNAFFQSILKIELSHALKNLLYRIDLTESQINNACASNPGMPLQEVLAELMIKRILQKVVLKELYSK